MRLASPLAMLTKYQASFLGLVGHIGRPGAFSPHTANNLQDLISKSRSRNTVRRNPSRSSIRHVNAIVCILFLCDATAAARLCMSCYQGPCVGMPSPASLHACRACRQPVRGHCLLRSERAWGHEVLVFSRPRKALTDIAIGLLKTVEQERLGFQILMVRRVYAFRISAISTIQCSCHWFCVNRSNLHMLTCRDHSKQVSCFTRFHSLIGFGKLKHP